MKEPVRAGTPLDSGIDRLFAEIAREHGLRFDAELARLLCVSKTMISRLRAGTVQITPGIILRIHEITGMPVATIRELSGVQAEWGA